MLKTSLLIFSLISISTPVVAEIVVEETMNFAIIYHKQCATCHGNKGDGQGRAGASLIPTPTSFISDDSKIRLTSGNMIIAIRDGVAGTSMSAYGRRFDDKTLTGLIDYIRQEFMVEKTAGLSKELIKNNNEGSAIYVQHCSACHGDKGNTAVWAKNALNPAPRNFTSAQSREELSLERMITSVTYGRPGTAMMSFEKRLNTEQIQSVVGFIRSTFMMLDARQAKTVQTENDHTITSPLEPALVPHIAVDPVNMSLPFPNNLIGDAKAGELFFQNNCFTCHGKKGDGKGPRSHFNIPKPRNFISVESRRIFNRPRLFKGISHGKPRTVMPAWSTVLSEQNIADVAEYVFQNFVYKKTAQLKEQRIEQKKKS